MITSIEIENFKRFLSQHLDFGMLNVLTGLNASGKSTILQALNLVNAAEVGSFAAVPLVGIPGLELGSASELIHYDSDETNFRVIVDAGGAPYIYDFDCGDASSSGLPYVSVSKRPVQGSQVVPSAVPAYQFLAAERLGPRVTLPVSPTMPGGFDVGADGRYVASVLAREGRAEVPSRRRNPGAGDVSTLAVQVEAWVSALVGFTQLEAAFLPRTPIATLRIRRGGTYGDWMLPTNTGFGVSYSLPIVVAGLTVPSGGVLAVDSPEAHLHPAAQSAIGGFLAAVAADGVQVFVETHSDHVLNGIRRAIAERRAPDARETFIWYLDDAGPSRIEVSDSGQLGHWPEGFFDQISRDLRALTAVAREGAIRTEAQQDE